MATPKWQPGKLYAPGSLVVPRVAPPIAPVEITNPGFEDDATGWTLDAGVTISTEKKYDGAKSARFSGSAGVQRVLHDAVACSPGKTISASAMYQQGAASSGNNTGAVFLRFYDDDDVQIGADHVGNLITSSSGGFKQTTVNVQSPAGTAKVAIGGLSNRSGDDPSFIDHFTWNLTGGFPSGLVFKAVQPATGYSDTVEPVWPTVNGEQVIDNEVIWEAMFASRVVYQARPILKSWPVEPSPWPTGIGESIADNTIKWVLTSRRVDDPNCPNSKVVVLDENKIYAADGDLIDFCAVNNPLDWTTPNNAGYLPFGNGKYGSNPVSALGLYRARLMAFNSEGMQDWQIDPDPALNHRLSSLPVGCTFHRSFAPVANDAFMLTGVGVRTLGLAASTANLATGDAGTPVDDMIMPLVRAGLEPRGIYVPSAGQYWLFTVGTDVNPYTPMGESGRWTPSFDGPADYYDFPPIPYNNITLVYVFTVSETGKVGAWQRYYLPFPVEAMVVAGDQIAVRAGQDILLIDEKYTYDLMQAVRGEDRSFIEADEETGENIDALLQWDWLEMGGQIGQEKTVEAFDLISTFDEDAHYNFAGDNDGVTQPIWNIYPDIAMGWNQRDPNLFSRWLTVNVEDTVPGEPIPFEMTGPSISVKLYFYGGKWKFTALNIYLQDWRLAR